MIPVRKVIEDALDLGVDTEELIDTLKENGWHLVHGPTFQRWTTQNRSDVLAYIGAVGDDKVVAKIELSDRALAHMPQEGLEHAKRSVFLKWAHALAEHLLGQTQS